MNIILWCPFCGRVSIIMLQKMYAQQGFCAYILGLKAKICTLLYL